MRKALTFFTLAALFHLSQAPGSHVEPMAELRGAFHRRVEVTYA